MITDIRVFNRKIMDAFVHNKELPFGDMKWNLISIHGDSTNFLTADNIEALRKKGFVKGLSLHFYDLTELDIYEFKKDKFFNRTDAKEIIGFLEETKKVEENEGLICQCDAGISRSGAVGLFACEFLEMSFGEFMSHNKHISPNHFVLNVLKQVAEIGGQKDLLTAEEIAMM